MKTDLIEVVILTGDTTQTFFFSSYSATPTQYLLYGMNGIEGINMTVNRYDCYIVPSGERENTKKVVRDITDFVNSYGVDLKGFCSVMDRQHRTLQNTFTKLCLTWMEYVNSDEYRTDPRNQPSKNVCSKLMKLWGEDMFDAGFTGETLELMSKPSGHIGMI